MKDMKGMDVVWLHDLNKEDIYSIMKTAENLKIAKKTGKPHQRLKEKTLAMIFQKPSTRTRISFEVGMTELGGHGLYLSSKDLQLRRGETIEDTAKVISRYTDGIMARVYDHQDIQDLAKNSSVPVINGLTDLTHPVQVLSDLFTIKEKKNTFDQKLAFVGDGNNLSHSLMFGGAKVGMDVSIATPEEYEPDNEIVELAKKDSKKSGAQIKVTNDPDKAVKNADIIYTDVWASMGDEDEKEERIKQFQPYQVNQELMNKANKESIFMHCLPAHRGEEVTAKVADGPNSVIFDQAENRKHAQKAIMALTM